MGKKSLIGKVWKFLEPPAAGRRRRRSHRLGGSTKTRHPQRGSASGERHNGQQSGQQKGRGWRCPVCNRRTRPVCTEVSDGMPCGFCTVCCPGHAAGGTGRADAHADDGGRFRFSAQMEA
jgi:hypothetical protein